MAAMTDQNFGAPRRESKTLRHRTPPTSHRDPRSRSTLWPLVSALAALALLLGPSRALAQGQGEESEDEKAERVSNLYISAVKLYNEGRNREAIAKFDEAIALDPQPVFHCNRAAVLLKVQELGRAIEDLEVCRDEYASNAKERAQIDAQLQAVTIVDNTLLNHSRSVAVEIANPNTAKGPDTVVIVQPDPPGGGEEERRRGPLRWVGYTTIALGSALMVSAGALDLASADLKNQYIKIADGGPGTTQEEYGNLKETLRRRQQAFYIMGFAGIGLNTIGISSLIIDSLKPAKNGKESSLWLRPSLDGGATLQLRVSF
jgi:tetratricopeptide (TPR) repeat protein